jgi:hypothetical protein
MLTRRLRRDEGRGVGRPDLLAAPEHLGLLLDVIAFDAEQQPVAPRPPVERGHESGRVEGPARPVGVLEDEAAGVVRHPRPSHFGKAESRIPHQRAVGEDPEIRVAVAGERLGPQGLARFVRMPPVHRQSQFTHLLGQARRREAPEGGLQRVGDLAAQFRVMHERIHR